jgi:CubicO group peptidase (beta-lactamase class C family)
VQHRVDTHDVVVGGFVAPGFDAVRDAFEDNLRMRGELGAAFALTRGEEALVDLWGGVADPAERRAWQPDTLQAIFSGTKGLVALCLAMLADRGALELSAPVARYWPEFAAAGKRDIRVRDVASHQARLPGIRVPLEPDEILDDRRMAALLAAQPVDPDPRAASVYHALTYGWLCGELVRRVDGRSIGRFFAEEVAEPLELELWIGLPPALEGRVAQLAYAAHWGEGGWTAEQIAADRFLDRVLNNPPLFPAGSIPWNRPAWHQAQVPGAGGIGTARAVARVYACLAAGGELGGVRLLGAATLEQVLRPLSRRWDPVARAEQAFACGFELQTRSHPFGPPDDAFGHRGAGGSAHGAWPSLGAGFSYAMNLMRDDEPLDPRAQALLTAAHAALVGAEAKRP